MAVYTLSKEDVGRFTFEPDGENVRLTAHTGKVTNYSLKKARVFYAYLLKRGYSTTAKYVYKPTKRRAS